MTTTTTMIRRRAAFMKFRSARRTADCWRATDRTIERAAVAAASNEGRRGPRSSPRRLFSSPLEGCRRRRRSCRADRRRQQHAIGQVSRRSPFAIRGSSDNERRRSAGWACERAGGCDDRGRRRAWRQRPPPLETPPTTSVVPSPSASSSSSSSCAIPSHGWPSSTRPQSHPISDFCWSGRKHE